MLKIISGCQDGSDRAFLDVAIKLGIPYGGYITKGRRTESGTVDLKYNKLIELDTWDYPTRTEKNITSSDGTIILYCIKLEKGSKLTYNLALKHKKPVLAINLDIVGSNVAADKIKTWLKEHPEIEILNGAGSRKSKQEGFEEKAYQIILKALSPDDSPASSA